MDISIDKFDLIVGFFVFFGLLAVACLSAFLAGPGLFDIGSVEVVTYLPSTYSLKKGVPVSYLEMPVGHVDSVELYDSDDPQQKVEVRFTINREFHTVIKNDFRTSLEAGTLGGIISGNIILAPPETGERSSQPVQNGDVLRYHKSASLLGDITNFSTQLQEIVLPKINSILSELDIFLQRLNDPQGDTRQMLSTLRQVADLLADPDGELQRTLKLSNNLAAALADENNILMQTLRNQQLIASLNETAGHVNEITGEGVEIAAKSSDALDRLVPQVDDLLKNLIAMQGEIEVLMKDAQAIASSVARATRNLPSMVDDAEAQLKEMEEITAAVKNISLIRWNLEDESTEEPVLLRPLLLETIPENAPDPIPPEE